MLTPPPIEPPSRSLIPLRVAAAILGLLGVFPLAVVIRNAPVLRWLPAASLEWLVATAIVVLLCLSIAASLGDRVDWWLDRLRAALLTPPPREFAAWSALVVLAGSGFFAWYCYAGQPIGGDELAQRFQSTLLLRGRLWAVAEEQYEFFSGIQTANIDGRWFSQFPIGGPALLAAGLAVGAAWVVNPVLAAWTAANLYRFASRTTDETTARVATLIFALSPFVLLMSGSQMNHAGSLAFLMMGLAALSDWSESDRPEELRRSAIRIGFGIGAMAAIRPLDAVAAGVVIGVFQLTISRGSPVKWRSLVWQVVGGTLPLAALLIVNWKTTGNPLLFGYDALNGASHRPGFHIDPTGNEFTPLQGVHHLSTYLLMLNKALLAGPIPAVLLMVIALALTRRATRWDYLLLGLLGAVLIEYGSYWAVSFFAGPRFLYICVPVFVLLVARIPEAIGARLRRPVLRRAAMLILPVSVAVAWLLPTSGVRYMGAWNAAGEMRTARDRTASVRRQVADGDLEGALVFVHESWHGRMTARLRALGAPALTAESLVRELDACGLHIGLDAEELFTFPPGGNAVERVVRRALASGPALAVAGLDEGQALALAPRRPHPLCIDELNADRATSTPLDGFLPYQGFAADGRLGGRVVFARDLGTRKNQMLIARFGDRTWYRYRPPTGPGDRAPVFVPYFGQR